METQEELLTSGPATFVVPTVAEVEMLKREQDQNKRTILELQRKVDDIREEREILDRLGEKGCCCYYYCCYCYCYYCFSCYFCCCYYCYCCYCYSIVIMLNCQLMLNICP